MDRIRVERAGPVTTVTLARPNVLNAIDAAMHDELEAAFNAFAADPDQWICVVTGDGRGFCAGSDLKSVVEHGHKGYPAHGYAGLIERFDCPKPFIAAVNGLALGGGFEVALACDIIVAAESASFGLPEPLVGAVALGGGVHRLARQIGLKQAMGMILASRRVSAAEGERLGFVTEVVPDGDLAAATQRWVDAILKGAPLSIRASKEAVMRGLDEPGVADAMRNQADYPAFATWRQSEDAGEGARAFAEKRAPVWKGR
ncbi:enoyl-CoA hydratase-related protein [Novosphingobium sp. KCTC 2891]|uniref:enoyl-CoA hydratase-related protein n=1 Tax=Novosphingobium sp. KCTC 2891 TaxID=2989730 RepID=UPI00222339E9|nr:enoyl-CoA hydratase-related protein [Novosphingobium sp. KCTC 2891]MCW1383303.1 enoyl-CoA hydratase-related protein [Novosphingobium sp. KCTC 2891]